MRDLGFLHCIIIWSSWSPNKTGYFCLILSRPVNQIGNCERFVCDFGWSSFIAVLYFDRYFVNKHLCLERCDMFVIVFYHIITNSVVCNFKSMKGNTLRESSDRRVERVDDLRDWISQRNIPAYETLLIEWLQLYCSLK